MIRKQLNGIEIILVPPKFEDSELPKFKGTHLQPSMIDLIIDHDTDVYSTEGTLLAKFRKSKLNSDNQDAFYNAISKHANKPNTCRFTANAFETRKMTDDEKLRNNPKIKSNIFGFLTASLLSRNII